MPRQQVEFEFPDPDKEAAAEIEVDIAEDDAPLEVEGAVGREDIKSPKDTIKAGDVEIEIGGRRTRVVLIPRGSTVPATVAR